MLISSFPDQCLGQHYALNEASVFMIRLLQRFEHFTLAEDKQLAPPWKTKPLPTRSSIFGPGYPGTQRKKVEKVWLGNHVVMFSKVRAVADWSSWPRSDGPLRHTGWNLDSGSQGFGVIDLSRFLVVSCSTRFEPGA
jgi:hypothetical protein